MSKQPKTDNPLESFAARTMLRLAAMLPLRINHGIGVLIGLLSWLLPTELRRVTRININMCFPGWRKSHRRRLMRRSLIETGKTTSEMGPLWLWKKDRALALIKEVSGEQHLREAMARGKGVILAIPHLGAWEVIGLYGSAHYPMTSLYRPPKLAVMDEIIRRGRERCGAKLVPTDNRGVRALYQALNRGELVAILPDQKPTAGQGVIAPFFDIPARTMTLLSRLAQKSDATVLMTYAERLPKGAGYHLHFSPAPEAVHDPNMETSATALNSRVEQCVRELPTQYQWSYKRFRRRINGKVTPY